MKSIIGYGYTPNGADAVCIETDKNAELGNAEYKIIKDPYERDFPIGVMLGFMACPPLPRTGRRTAVNVLDTITGLITLWSTSPQTSFARPMQRSLPISFAGYARSRRS